MRPFITFVEHVWVPVALASTKQPLDMIAQQAAQEENIQHGHISLCNNPKKHRFLLCMQQTTLLAYTLPRLLSIFISFTWLPNEPRKSVFAKSSCIAWVCSSMTSIVEHQFWVYEVWIIFGIEKWSWKSESIFVTPAFLYFKKIQNFLSNLVTVSHNFTQNW